MTIVMHTLFTECNTNLRKRNQSEKEDFQEN